MPISTPLPDGWLDPDRRAARQRDPWLVPRLCSPDCTHRHTWSPVHQDPPYTSYRRGATAWLCTGDLNARNLRNSRGSEGALTRTPTGDTHTYTYRDWVADQIRLIGQRSSGE